MSLPLTDCMAASAVTVAMPKCLRTERLRIRHVLACDAPNLYQSCTSNPEVARYQDWGYHRSVGDAAQFIRDMQHAEQLGNAFFGAMILRRSNRLIGMVMCRIDVEHHCAELGYLLAPALWGHGYAQEASRAIIDWVSTVDVVSWVGAIVDTENRNSQRLLTRLGFDRTKTVPAAMVCPDLGTAPRDIHVYCRAIQR